MTNAIRLDHLNNEILISKSFAKAAMNPTSDEYKDLAEIQRAHPDYKISKRDIKKNPYKKTYAGLNYQYMRNYIIKHTPPEETCSVISEFEEMILISKCHTRSFGYATIKNWFLERYPEIAEFGIGAHDYTDQFAS